MLFLAIKLFSSLKPKKWAKLSPSQRLNVAQNFENYYSRKFSRSRFRVLVDLTLDKTTMGLMEYDKKTIKINPVLISNELSNNPFLLMSTLFHEGRHVYQKDCITNEMKQNGKLKKFSKTNRWQNSFGGYVDDEFYKYANQSIELDAHDFARKRMKKLKWLYKKHLAFINELERLDNFSENIKEGAKKKYGRFYKFKIARENKKRNKNN